MSSRVPERPTLTEAQRMRATAWTPFDIDDQGLPLHPHHRTRHLTPGPGRCRAWGENRCVDAIVLAGARTHRRLLVITRGDTGHIALPGGHLNDPDEDVRAALARELAEETGLELEPAAFSLGDPVIHDDPRDGLHAWRITQPGRTALDEPVPVHGGDDATSTLWLPASSFQAFASAVREHRRQIYPPHIRLIAEALR